MSEITDLQDVVHQKTRLAILTIAAEVKSVQFGYLQNELDLSPGNLGGHLAVLEDAKMIKVLKGFQGRRPSTTISITASGRNALADEIQMLKAIVDRVERAEKARTKESARATSQAVQRRGLTTA